MAKFQITGPDGASYEVEAPDSADESQVLAYAKGEFTKQKQKADADAYAGQDVGQMGAIMRGLGGAKHSWDRGAMGIKGLVTDLSEEDKTLLRQGEAFKKQAGWAGSVGEFGGDVAMTAAPGAGLMRGVQVAGMAARALPRALGVRSAIATGTGATLANPLVASGLSGAAVGAATSPEDRKGGAIGGAVGGVLGEGAGRVLTRTLGGPMANSVSPEARALMDEGVGVPLWKAVESPGIRNMAERAKALPLVGSMMRGQERAAMGDYNRTLVRGATPPQPVLDEVGNVIRWAEPRSVPTDRVGQDGMQALHERFNEAYDAVYRGRVIPLDDALATELHQIAQQAEHYMPGAAPDVLGAMRRASDTLHAGTETTSATVTRGGERVGSGRVSGRMTTPQTRTTTTELGHEGVNPENFKRALNELDDAITNAYRAGQGEKAQQIELIRDALHSARQRGLPPEVAASLAPVNNAYGNYKLLQRASASLGAVRQEGIVTPLQMTNAVKANDRTVGKSATTRGNARGQQDAQRAQRVLGSELPEVGPGTAEKLMLLGGFGGLAKLAPPVAIASLLASRPGQRALMGGYGIQRTVRNNPEALAHALRSAGMAEGI